MFIINGIQRLARQFLPTCYTQIAGIHSLTKTTQLPAIQSQTLLQCVDAAQIRQTRGLKFRNVLQLRCKDCYYEMIDDVLHVQCKTHGRHKQKKYQAKLKNRWIITSICNKPKREW